MSNSRSNNSNKTAHVMNLLRKNVLTADSVAADVPAAPMPSAAPAAPTAPLLSSLQSDAAISADIRDALESVLVESAPVQEVAPPPQEVAPPQEAAPPTQPEPEKAPAAQEQDDEVPPVTNVMHRLVEDRVDKYIELFGLCPCPRCRNDVLALTLNAVAPKYIVMAPAELGAMMDMLGTRFNGEITTHIMQACKTVMDNPRHEDAETVKS